MDIIAFFNNNDFEHPITGGHIYNSILINSLKKIDEINLEINDDFENIDSIKNTFQKLKKLFKNKEKNCVVIYNIFNIKLGLSLILYKCLVGNIKIYPLIHHFRYQENQGLNRKKLKFLEYFIIKKASDVICPNPYVIDEIKKISNNKKGVLIGHIFKKNQKLSDFTKFNLLFVGTMYYRKGIDLLIEAINLLPSETKEKIQVNLVGNTRDENYVNFIKQKIQDYYLEKSIHIIGSVSQEQLINYYTDSYVFIFPSRHEGYGMVIEEAMSHGLPVIAFNNSAMPYSIKDGENGMLIEDGDIKALADAIEKIIQDSQFHKKLVKGALIHNENCHSETDLNSEIRNFVSSLN
ncbi:MAG: glycosyltransferase family 4 protein [Muribaculaceae bacterium]|nr:glycosyltransferase family 4 protein [Muribaculaceae bacterium]